MLGSPQRPYAWIPRRPSDKDPNPPPALAIVAEYPQQKEVKRLEKLPSEDGVDG